jgi:hypothetical protein
MMTMGGGGGNGRGDNMMNLCVKTKARGLRNYIRQRIEYGVKTTHTSPQPSHITSIIGTKNQKPHISPRIEYGVNPHPPKPKTKNQKLKNQKTKKQKLKN